MRSHSYCSACQRPPSIQSKPLTKCSESFSRYSSGDGMPCFFANANAVFFCVSVATTSELSPVRYESTSAAPRSCERDVEVDDLVARGVAVDPHDAVLGLAVLVRAEADGHVAHGLAPSVGRIGERAEQQRHVEVPVVVRDLDGEGHGDEGIEGRDAVVGELGARAEGQGVHARLEALRAEARADRRRR